MNTRFSNWTTKKKVIVSILILFLILIGTGVGYSAYIYSMTEEMVIESHESIKRPENSSPYRTEDINPVEDNVSVLFIGVDDSEHRNNQNSRSDALILATFNIKESSVKLLSIPRDSYVYIPEVDYSSKINHAHAYGGPLATIETIEHLLEIPVDYYVRLDFNAFIEVVDTLDGIEFDVPYEMVELDSDDNEESIHLYPGKQHVNGEEALALARTRKYDSDIERGQRQQELLNAIINKAISTKTFFRIDELVTAIGTNMKTNMTFEELKSFFLFGIGRDISMKTVNLNGSGGYLDDGGWYFVINEDSKSLVQEELQKHLGLDSPNHNYTNNESDTNKLN
ncbi:LCP family protein [Oceanobacillus massiliensis]|uniref:LCP family protein n=1 Tax=Oceanobacillus massiliensis TaxID=1465765 RepID=UPI0030187954